jgi:glucosamine 6-phosphate synthetase-like amidotransferase/phosphosugar isomerase protein
MKMNKIKYDSPMLRQARAIPDLIQKQYVDLEPKIRKLFTTPEIYSFQKIILTGCGDSYAACLAAKSAFEDFGRVPVEVLTAVDLSRHYPEKQLNYGPNSPLIISVSNSGQVARIAEGILRANTTSAYTVGLTKNADSPLGKNARKVLLLNPPEFESSPGVGSYCVSLLALLLLAIRIGEVKLTYTMDEANEYRSSLLESAELMAKQMNTIEDKVFSIAEEWKDFPGFDFVGSGSDYSSVFFGQAKIIEAVGRYAMHINTEEWLHLNFFLRNAEQTGTVLIANSNNPAASRIEEVSAYMKQNNRPLLIISDSEDLKNKGENHIILPKSSHGSFSSLCQFIPVSMLAGFLSTFAGEEYGRGLKGNWGFSHGGEAIKDSKIIILGSKP